jgi:uncharacterized membrane protein YqiK
VELARIEAEVELMRARAKAEAEAIRARATAESEVLKGRGKAEAKAENYRHVLEVLRAYGHSAPDIVSPVLKNLTTSISFENNLLSSDR